MWIDADNSDVLRFDEAVTGYYDFPIPRDKERGLGPMMMTIERADSSIRYKPVTFHDPDETLMLPASITSLQIVRNAGVPRLRTTQTFTDYRRFVTGARIVDAQ